MKLNLKQKKILELVSINCRFSNKDVAKAVRLSEDAVEYQIDKLVNKEKLANFNVQFHYLMLGYDSYHMWVKLEDPEKVDYDALKDMKELVSINSSFGRFDLQLIVLSKTKKELNEIIKKIKKFVAVRNYKLAKFLDLYKRFSNILPPFSVHSPIPKNKKNFVYELSGRTYAKPLEGDIKIDAVDRKIIKELIKNPRASFQEISRKTRLNHETIRYRIRNYVKKRFITNFGLLHDFGKYGLYTAYFLFELKGVDKKRFSSYLEDNENVFYSAELDGEYNCIVYVVSSDPKEMGAQFRGILGILGKSVKKSELLILEKVHKYIQFPEKEL